MQTAREPAERNALAGMVGLPGQQPYLITVSMNDGAFPVAVVATRFIAFSVYYATIREYVGTAKVRLSEGERTLASSVN